MVPALFRNMTAPAIIAAKSKHVTPYNYKKEKDNYTKKFGHCKRRNKKMCIIQVKIKFYIFMPNK